MIRKLLRIFHALCFICTLYVIDYSLVMMKKYHNERIGENVPFQRNVLHSPPNPTNISDIGETFAQHLKEIQRFYHNAPIKFLSEMKNIDGRPCNLRQDNILYNKSNDMKLLNITFNNQYWQEFKSIHGMFYLYNAYLDSRKQAETIRIISIIDEEAVDAKHYCLIWYDNLAEPEVSIIEKTHFRPVSMFRGVNDSVLNRLRGYLLSCKIPEHESQRIPQAVSIVDNANKEIHCFEASNYLKLNYNHEEKNDFAVCVKGYTFEKNHAAKLIEWIELVSILGARKILIYELGGDPDVRKVLDYYIEKGLLDVIKTSLPGHKNFLHPEYLKNHLHLDRIGGQIQLNDCLYRNIDRYRYIATMDIDEVIVPTAFGHRWSDMIKSVSTKYPNSDFYLFQNTYFFDNVNEYHPSIDNLTDIPNTNHMLHHVYRSVGYSKGKSLFRTEYVKRLDSHHPRDCIDRPCEGSIVSSKIAQVNHYRHGCQLHEGTKEQCYEKFYKNVTMDTRLWEFKEELVLSSKKVLSKLGLAEL